ncbi:exodeoxyribonuclease VII large subunit [Acetonema longum]|uniref:Exodeoxyribonuclease 7 large subunit n=1 Tax=Acetonema longum DSM 6540 TaxID=1009370 RepID=F7NJY4_9FIRM|nr:exodeoxyribonuclease VII large subunit [Acetonema longum]EGO63631.1 exodeoxyribonuclease VII, large subunit [Acetonema longum DSM 6540]
MEIITVSELTRFIKRMFDADRRFASVFVRGEISNFKRHYSGHCYLTLKDSEAVIRVVMFRSKAQNIKFELRDGLKVVIGGYVSVFERDGQYQLYAEQLLPEGVGELSLAFAQLKDKLSKEGLFDEARKRPLPFLPKSIGVITSPTGAVIRDIITVAKRRHPGISILLYPVQVQGAEAPPQIVRALKIMNELQEADVLIVGRGGGSLEELWPFNDEQVARAIAASQIPVVSAVGHQTDFTLADFAADRRAATPSQAAEIVVPDIRELFKYMGTLTQRLELGMGNLTGRRRQRLEQLFASRALQQPRECTIAGRRQVVDLELQRLLSAYREATGEKKRTLAIAAEKLHALSPLAVLSRGYGIIRKCSGSELKPVASVQSVNSGDAVEIILQDGKLQAEIKTKSDEVIL